MAIIRVVDTEGVCIFSGKTLLLQLRNVGDIPTKSIFEPTDGLQTPLLGYRNHLFQHVIVAEIRSPKTLQRRVVEVFRVHRGEASSMNGVGAILLLAMIGQRLPGHLPAGNAAAVGKSRYEQRVYGSISLKDV